MMSSQRAAYTSSSAVDRLAVARALNTSDGVSGRPRMFITSKMRCAPSRSSVVTMTSVTSLTRYCANCWRPASDQLEISSYVLRMLATILRCAAVARSSSFISNTDSRLSSCTCSRKNAASRSRNVRRGSVTMPRSLSPGSTSSASSWRMRSGSRSRSRNTAMMIDRDTSRCCPSITS